MPNIDMSQELAYRPGERARLYNVLLIVIDDLRADHLSAYGYERETSPFLDSRLGRATLFANCHSPVGWTLPACASIITGQLPDSHGLYDHNQKFRKPKIGHYLGSDYERFAVTNNGNVVTDTISREYLEKLGLERRPAKWKFFHWNDGFDRYEWVAREDHLLPYEIAREFLSGRRDAEAGDRPYFFFFHSNMVHDYHMDRDYYLDVEEWLGEPVHPGLLSVRDGPDIWQTPPSGVDLETVTRHMVAKYDAGIRSVDRLVDGLLGLVNFDDTIVVFMSDHGEGFDPRFGRVHHCGRLHSDLTHVPLAIWLPPELRARYEPEPRIEHHCSTVDVAPTLLTLLGDAVAGFPGQFLYDLAPHRRIDGIDRGYIYWNEDCVRESYDTARIEIRSEFTYPLKRIDVGKNDAVKSYAYNVAYDPLEHDNLREVPAARMERFEPISFVVAVNDTEELRHNTLASPVASSTHHEWLLVDNRGNDRFDSISALYCDALARARHDLVFFLHQDLYLPDGWEARLFAALASLEETDPDWGVIGGVGAIEPIPGQPKELKGHWCDPSGYHRVGPLPHVVQSLDEQWLGVRKKSGVTFDANLPGFHCYGIDVSLCAFDLGLKSYAIDCFVWHKYKDSDGYLIGCRDDSSKIRDRWSEEFMADFRPSADYVEEKWKKYLPFQTTSWSWGVD